MSLRLLLPLNVSPGVPKGKGEIEGTGSCEKHPGDRIYFTTPLPAIVMGIAQPVRNKMDGRFCVRFYNKYRENAVIGLNQYDSLKSDEHRNQTITIYMHRRRPDVSV